MLVLAASADAEDATARRDAVWRRLLHLHQPGAGELLLHLGDLRLHGFTRDDERHEHHKVIQAPHAFAAEGQVADLQRHALADDGGRGEDGAFRHGGE